eukprot:6134070-Pyramimonas_sp.AAC.1
MQCSADATDNPMQLDAVAMAIHCNADAMQCDAMALHRCVLASYCPESVLSVPEYSRTAQHRAGSAPLPCGQRCRWWST